MGSKGREQTMEGYPLAESYPEEPVPDGVVDTPVRVRRILGADGREHRAIHVFCVRRAESVPFSECRSCERCISYRDLGEGGQSTLTCRMEEPLGAIAPAPSSPTLAGGTMSLEVTCVEPDVRLAEALAKLPGESAIVPVVTDDGVLLGVVHLVRHRQHVTSPLRPMHELMSASSPVVDEASPLEEALRTMAAARQRWITVVTCERRVVGVLEDVEAMHRLFSRARPRIP